MQPNENKKRDKAKVPVYSGQPYHSETLHEWRERAEVSLPLETNPSLCNPTTMKGVKGLGPCLIGTALSQWNPIWMAWKSWGPLSSWDSPIPAQHYYCKMTSMTTQIDLSPLYLFTALSRPPSFIKTVKWVKICFLPQKDTQPAPIWGGGAVLATIAVTVQLGGFLKLLVDFLQQMGFWAPYGFTQHTTLPLPYSCL